MKTWKKTVLNRYRFTLQQQYTEAGMLMLIPVSVMLRYCVSYYARILYVLHVYFR